MNHLDHLISALEPPWAHLVARCLEEALPTSRVSFAGLPPGSSGTKTEPCLGLFLTNCHQSCMFLVVQDSSIDDDNDNDNDNDND